MIGKDGGVFKAWEATVRRTHAVAKKRANSIFGLGALSITNADDEEGSHHDDNDENGNQVFELYTEEKVLSNGDYYTGQWAENFPHGEGKYLWTDGCMYVGQWFKGKTKGKGRFSWPSGATYEGEFKTGFMDGVGTYTGINGETYKGQWVMNLKHGHGYKSYVNGDWYEGDWRRGVQDGKGRYEWRDMSHYIGEWKHGIIWGKGSFFWPNGNSFEGIWEDGLPKGNGTFRWQDGSYYVGNFSKDDDDNNKDENGNFYPFDESSNESYMNWDPRDLYSELSGYSVCPSEKVSVLPSQKRLAVWRSTRGGESGKPRRMSVDGRASVGGEKPSDRMNLWDGGGSSHGGGGECDASSGGNRTPPTLGSEYDDDSICSRIDDANDDALNQLQPLKAPKKSKRQGETICKGHKNFELMLNLQLGIR